MISVNQTQQPLQLRHAQPHIHTLDGRLKLSAADLARVVRVQRSKERWQVVADTAIWQCAMCVHCVPQDAKQGRLHEVWHACLFGVDARSG